MDALAEVINLKTYFVTSRDLFGHPLKTVKAVDDVSLSVGRHETVGVVGESGCGKSTLGRSFLKLVEPCGGKILFNGENIADYSQSKMRPLRRQMQLIFQDAVNSLNPRRSIFDSVKEALDVANLGDKRERPELVREMLATVGITSALYDKYPNELSGGQCQRAAIARAVISNPDFVVCDEAVSALDVSVRSSVLNLLKDLQAQKGMSCLFISHDLSVINYMSDRVVVMYLGKIVESAPTRKLFEHPAHPYTKALLSAIPIPQYGVQKEYVALEGEVPSPLNPPSGCRFHTRCPYAGKECEECCPTLHPIENDHYVACHRVVSD